LTIAIICDVLGEANNGTTIAAMNLIRSLREKGHTIRVVCADPERSDWPDYYIVPRYNFGPFNRYVEKNGVAPARVDQAVLEAAISDADIIHVMLPFALGKAAARYAAGHGIPLTAGFHCQAENVTNHLRLMNVRWISNETYRIFHRRLYRYCNCIHYPTQFICDTYEAVVGPTPHRVISNGVSEEFVPGPSSRPPEYSGRYVMLFTGRYSIEKSHWVLIDAVSRSRHRDDIQLVFAGAGPLEKVLRRYAARKKIPMPVMRFYSRSDLIDVIRFADLYVHPAEIEIESIACLEAIACGKVPLIADSPRSATRAFALSERNLFRHNDPKDLAEKLDWWLEHPEEVARCARDYLGYAQQFCFSSCMDQMEQMLLETMEETGHGA